MATKAGRPKKAATEGKNTQIGIRCEIWLKHRLIELAKREERTITQIARQAIKDYVQKAAA